MFSYCLGSTVADAQAILGNWQLVKQTNCMDDHLMIDSDSTQELIDEMKSMSSALPQVVKFREKGAGEESTRILNKKKTANNKTFNYKFNGNMLLILDKKSQTITANYTVDKISADSLILSHASRPCETRIFLKIKEPKTR